MNYNKKIVVVTELALLTIFSVALTVGPLYQYALLHSEP